MGWKYRKRIRIVPGFNLNLSKTGMSATIGMKCFSVNMGKNGTYLNTGIPGTGIYDRIRLDKNNPKGFTVNNQQDIQPVVENDAIEIKSFQPELLSSDGLYGLKESIVKSQEIKKELKEEWEKAISKKNLSLFIVIITHMLIFGIFIKKLRNNYKNDKANAKEAEETYNNFKLDIDFNMDQSILNDYILLKNSFQRLTGVNKIWDITSAKSIDRVKERSSASTTITREVVAFSNATLDYINTKYDAFKFKNANGGDLFIYPGFIIMPSEVSNDFALIDFRDVSIEHHGQRFVETDPLPSDATVVGYTYKYVNKNGSPDKRYSNNPQIPIAIYYELVLKSQKGLYESFEFSNSNVGEIFCKALESYKESLSKMKWDKEEMKEIENESV
jgi:hypothetical protein